MNAYRFDADTKEYLFELTCDESPLEPGVWLVPAYSTLTEPPEEQDGYARVWDEDAGAWVQTEDHRRKRDDGGVFIEGSGTPYWLDGDSWNTPARYMSELGPLPDGAMTTAPDKTFDEVKAEKEAELAAAFSTASENAYVTSSLGFDIDADETANRNISGLITSMEASGTESVSFCDYNNEFHDVTVDDLKTMLLEVIANGQELYAKKWVFREQIEAAETVDELNAITISFD